MTLLKGYSQIFPTTFQSPKKLEGTLSADDQREGEKIFEGLEGGLFQWCGKTPGFADGFLFSKEPYQWD